MGNTHSLLHVELAELLSDIGPATAPIASSSRPTVTPSLQLDVEEDDYGLVSVSTALAAKCRQVSSLPSWLEDLPLYAGMLAIGNPALALQFFRYQLIIDKAAASYQTSAWRNYDIQFRSSMAID